MHHRGPDVTREEAIAILDQLSGLLDQRRYRPAIAKLSDVATHCEDLPQRLLASFNLGTVYWAQIGDGEAARRQFLMAVELGRLVPPDFPSPLPRKLYANACEDLMLLSLSFEEYEERAAELESFQPENAILIGQAPSIRDARDRGLAWSALLRGMAQVNYDRRDSARDNGRYGCGLATFRLMLARRKELRLPRDDWSVAVSEVAILAMRVLADCNQYLEDRGIPHDQKEYYFLLEDTIPAVEEYVTANPADETNAELLQKLREVLAAEEIDALARRSRMAERHGPAAVDVLRSRWAKEAQDTSGNQDPRGAPLGCLLLAFLIVGSCTGGVGSLVGWALGAWLPGLIVGVLVAGFAVTQAYVAQRRTQSPRG
jgi:hypothetical protein